VKAPKKVARFDSALQSLNIHWYVALCGFGVCPCRLRVRWLKLALCKQRSALATALSHCYAVVKSPSTRLGEALLNLSRTWTTIQP